MELLKADAVTMSSREIAELTGKNHSDVMRDIRALVKQLQAAKMLSVAKTSSYTGSTGQSYPMYELDKNTCLTLLLGYDAVARMKVVKRWQELENSAPKLPNFANPAEAARAWADEYEQKLVLQVENKELKTEVKKLTIALDEHAEWASVKKMETRHGCKFPWQPLKATSIAKGYAIHKVPDQNYEAGVNAYHRDVWLEVYKIKIG